MTESVRGRLKLLTATGIGAALLLMPGTAVAQPAGPAGPAGSATTAPSRRRTRRPGSTPRPSRAAYRCRTR
ncbi:hypothetical protein [Plantactinospora veratri]